MTDLKITLADTNRTYASLSTQSFQALVPASAWTALFARFLTDTADESINPGSSRALCIEPSEWVEPNPEFKGHPADYHVGLLIRYLKTPGDRLTIITIVRGFIFEKKEWPRQEEVLSVIYQHESRHQRMMSLNMN